MPLLKSSLKTTDGEILEQVSGALRGITMGSDEELQFQLLKIDLDLAIMDRLLVRPIDSKAQCHLLATLGTLSSCDLEERLTQKWVDHKLLDYFDSLVKEQYNPILLEEVLFIFTNLCVTSDPMAKLILNHSFMSFIYSTFANENKEEVPALHAAPLQPFGCAHGRACRR